MAIANKEKYIVHQMDLKSATLNGELKENVYMKQPEGFEKHNKVCKLNKTMYGLKQASKGWNERFNHFMHKITIRRIENDQCIYLRKTGKDVS